MILAVVFCFIAFVISMIVGVSSGFNKVSKIVVDKYFEDETATTFTVSMSDLTRKKPKLDKTLTFKKLG
ncbi:hypothetical protein phiOC_p151 [Ochrobactrum phage vB_OspM_OC]|nr:hypothetical protein phiOC_p151 [Ochrobactrum phage vB_OspM_OC]